MIYHNYYLYIICNLFVHQTTIFFYEAVNLSHHLADVCMSSSKIIHKITSFTHKSTIDP